MRQKEELLEIVEHLRAMGAVHIKIADLEAVFLPPQTEEQDVFLSDAPAEENLKTWLRTPPSPEMLRPRSR